MQTLANYLLYGLAMSMLRGLACLPLGVAYWLGAHLGGVLYLVLARRRRVVFENLAIAFGTDKTAEERRQIARATFRNLGQHVVDLLHRRSRTYRDASPARYGLVNTVSAFWELGTGASRVLVSYHTPARHCASSRQPRSTAPR